ncbi:MAG: hydroxymethylbilane synthase [Candidatus Aminicenantia bacterium]
MKKFRIGTRGSKLALWQANWIKEKIENIFKDIECETVPIKTTGDKFFNVRLFEQSDKGFFTKEIEEALINKKIDIAVHSLKDLPTEIPEELEIGAVTKRETPNDVLISKEKKTLKDLPKGAKIGTSSLRRKSQLLNFRNDLIIVDLRGNLDTRIRKLNTTDLDGIVIAYAGVKRLGFEDLISEMISFEIVLPAIGQGALAVEIRKNDEEVYNIVKDLNHKESCQVISAERSFMKRLHGGCQIPVGAYGFINNNILTLEGMISNLDGTRIIRKKVQGKSEEAGLIGIKLAEEILNSGGKEILQDLKSQITNSKLQISSND